MLLDLALPWLSINAQGLSLFHLTIGGELLDPCLPLSALVSVLLRFGPWLGGESAAFRLGLSASAFWSLAGWFALLLSDSVSVLLHFGPWLGDWL